MGSAECRDDGAVLQARRLAVAVAVGIASHCPDAERDAHGGKAATMIGALASLEHASHGDGLAYAGQLADEMFSRSVVCRNNHLCGIHHMCQQIIDLLADHSA